MRIFLIFFFSLSLFGQTPHERAWKILDQGVHDSNPLKRAKAVLSMAVLKSEPRATVMVEEALNDKDVSVREAACETLAHIRARTSIPKLQMALADGAPEVIFAAAKALYDLGDSTGQQVLSAILLGDQPDSSGFMSASVRNMKHKMHDPKALLELSVRAGAGFAVPGGGVGVAGAEGLMKDNQASGKTVAALLLATDNTPDSFMALNAGLLDKNWTVRSAATEAIGLRGAEELDSGDAATLYDNVTLLLDDKTYQVQFAAAATLIRLKEPAGAGDSPTGAAKTKQ
jgi:HEAT repeat protein